MLFKRRIVKANLDIINIGHLVVPVVRGSNVVTRFGDIEVKMVAICRG